ncbi:MAG TPA: DMT family transporter [Ideonella sp.]|nr:DMT family transporter [Ideonella sp.]
MWIGACCGLAVALIWSSWTVATRIGVTHALGPADLTFLRFGVSGLLLWPVLARRGLGLRKLGWPRTIVMLAGAGLPFMLVASTGTRFAPASHLATLMIGVMPIFVALLSVLLYRERLAPLQILGLMAVMAGVGSIGGHALLMNRASGEWRGDLLFLLGGLLFASYTLAQRRSGLSSWQATALINVTSGLIFTPIYFGFLQPRLLSAPVVDVIVQVLAQGIGVAILGLFFFAEATRRLGATRAAIFGSLTPALSVVLSIPLLGESPSRIVLLGVVLITVGVLTVVAGKQS